MTSAERKRAYRRRQDRERASRRRARERAGRVVLAVEVDECAVAEALIASGFLSVHADDRDSLARAVEELLAAVVAVDLESHA